MGVEYRHFLVVNEPEWRPQPDTAARVESVLRDWSIVERLEKVINLALGANNEVIDNSTVALPGPGVAFIYAGVQGSAVERIAGASMYEEVNPEDRYTMQTALVVGDDYRLHWSSEGIYFELISPPLANGEPVLADEEEEPYATLFANSFPATGITSPPVVKAHIEEYAKANVAWQNYQGYWRGAVVIDFGKDLPSFAEEAHLLPARDFVAALSTAFRGPIVEVGEIY